jgi:hypothetical protein
MSAYSEADKIKCIHIESEYLRPGSEDVFFIHTYDIKKKHLNGIKWAPAAMKILGNVV